MPPLDLSVVVPVFNEAGNLSLLHRQVGDALAGGPEFELLIVDDGSTDGSFDEASRIATTDRRVRVVRLGRNFGQTAAIQAGIDHARGRVVVTIDGDLQNDPADIPRLLEELDRGYDVVCGWRKSRHGGLLSRRLPSRVANRVIRLLTGVRIHDHGCTLKAFRREVISRESLYSDMHRFLLVMMELAGVRYTELVVKDRQRTAGRSKYGLKRLWAVPLDLITLFMLQHFSAHPGRWFLLSGLPFVVLAAAFLGGVIGQYAAIAGATEFPVVYLGGVVLSLFASLHAVLLAVVSELVVGSTRRQGDVLVAEAAGKSPRVPV